MGGKNRAPQRQPTRRRRVPLRPKPQRWSAGRAQLQQQGALRVQCCAQRHLPGLLARDPNPGFAVPAEQASRRAKPGSHGQTGSHQPDTGCSPMAPPGQIRLHGPRDQTAGTSGQHGCQQPALKTGMPHRIADRWGVVHGARNAEEGESRDQLRSRRALENQRAVGATKAKVVLDGHVNLHVAGGIGAVVQVAIGVLVEEVDGWRTLLVVQRQHRHHRL